MSDQINSHPIHHWLKHELRSEEITQPDSIAIISPHLQFSFVFHISLNLLSNHRSNPDQYVVIIIPRSQADFHEQVNLEADAHLTNLDRQLNPLLGSVQFCFCDQLSQLIELLNRMSKLSSNEALAISKVLSIIVLNPTSYISPESNLSSLPQVLSLITLTQETISKTQPPPILIHLENLHQFQDTLIHQETSIFKVFDHFCNSIWTIDHHPPSPQALERFTLKSLKDPDQSTIKYEVLSVDDQDQLDSLGKYHLTKILQ